MASRPPIPDRFHIPKGGINPDANGVTIKEDQCIDALNMKIKNRELETRSGYRRLGKNFPSDNPVLHVHTWKKPDGEDTLFAFTKDAIFKYTNASERWLLAQKHTEVQAFAATTGMTAKIGTYAITLSVVNTVNKYYATSAVNALIPISTLANDDLILQWKAADPGAWDDVSDYTHISFYYRNNHTADIPVTVKFYNTDVPGGIIESFNTTLIADAGNYRKATLQIGSGTVTTTDWTDVNAFEIIARGATVFGAAANVRFDYMCAVNHFQTVKQVSLWSTTDFLDDDEGSTIIAAASDPPIATESEDDGDAHRYLLFYDVSEGYFDTLTPLQKIRVIEEDEAKIGDEAVVESAAELSAMGAGDKILPASFTIYTAELGNLATCSSILNTDVDGSGGGATNGYALLPVDETHVEIGDESYILEDGSAWSIKITDDKYDGLNIYIDYTYSTSANVLPRFVKTFHNRIMYLNTYEDTSAAGGEAPDTYFPWRARWSEIGKKAEIDMLEFQDVVDTDITPINGAEFLGPDLYIMKEQSIVQALHAGGSGASIFLFNTVLKDGTHAGRTMATYHQWMFFLGKDDVYLWDGAARKSITFDSETNGYRIQEDIFSSIDRTNIHKCFGAIYSPRQEYWLFIVRVGEDYPKLVYVFSIIRNTWTKYEFADGISSIVPHRYEQADVINDMHMLINDNDSIINTFGTLVEAFMFGGDTGEVFIYDDSETKDGSYISVEEEVGSSTIPATVAGTTFSWHIITRDFIFNEHSLEDRCTRLDFEALGEGAITVGYSTEYDNSVGAFSSQEAITPTANFTELNYFPDAVGEKIRFMLTSTDPATIRHIYPWAIRLDNFNK